MPEVNFVAFLRAINVGGTTKLPMDSLREIFETAGLKNVRTYLATGNVLLVSNLTSATIKKRVESRLETIHGRPIQVFIRTSDELEAILRNNPFASMPANRTVALLLENQPDPQDIASARGMKNEQIQLGQREIYIYYPDGIGQSKLQLNAIARGTARNMNTIGKLCKMCCS